MARQTGSFEHDRPRTRTAAGAEPGSRAERPEPRTGGGAESPAASPDARDPVFELLRTQVRRFPDLPIQEPRTDRLEPRDAALAHAIHECVLRRWLTLRWLVTRHTRGPFSRLQPGIRAALLAGAAQIVFLDRVPTHAAVSTAVAWVKRRGGGARAAGLVNAVLRRVGEDAGENGFLSPMARLEDAATQIPLPDGRALASEPRALPEDPIERLSVTTSLPTQLLTRWRERFGEVESRRLAVQSLANPPVILNTAHAKAPLPENASPHRLDGHALLEASGDAARALLGARTDVWVQDPASAGAVRSIADLEPACIVDLCAGLGTKTRQLAATFPGARILATDRDRTRFRTLQDVFADHERVEVIPYDGMWERGLEAADLALLDVPCSNTGVLSRRLEARYRVSAAQLEELAGIQRQLIADSIPLLTPHGRILLATCSLEPEENSAHAAWAGKWHGFEATRERLDPPAGGPLEPAAAHADGSYSVLLSRGGRGADAEH